MANYKVMLSAGEASGDLHAANLLRQLQQCGDNIEAYGMGADNLRDAGSELLVDCRDIAVVGLVEVVKHWNEIKAALNVLKQALKDNPPDLLILVDYVEFNLKLAAEAKALGIKVMFYVSPQVWAWREGRVPKIGKVIDMMAVIFPFEEAIYQQYDIPVRYVGHPLADEVEPTMSAIEASNHFGLSSRATTVAILPGSRRSEVSRILPVMLQSAEIIAKVIPDVQFILPIAPTLKREDIEPLTKQCKASITLCDGQSHDAVNVSEAVMVASGTATLEVALLGKPMSIIYTVSELSYHLLKRLMKVEHIGLANIVAGRRVVPEFVQHYANPYLIAQEVIQQLNDAEYNQHMRLGLDVVKQQLGEGGGSAKVAALAHEMLSEA